MKGVQFIVLLSSLVFDSHSKFTNLTDAKQCCRKRQGRYKTKENVPQSRKKCHFPILHLLIITLQLEKTPMQIQSCKTHLAQENV